MKVTIKQIRSHFEENGYTPRHEFKSLKYAANKLSEETNINAFDLLLLVIENKPIDSCYTHSYGFHTGEGRYLIDSFTHLYNNHIILK